MSKKTAAELRKANELREAQLALMDAGKAEAARRLAPPVAPIVPAIPDPPTPKPTAELPVAIAPVPPVPPVVVSPEKGWRDITELTLEDFGEVDRNYSTRLPSLLQHTLKTHCAEYRVNVQEFVGRAIFEHLQNQSRLGRKVRVFG